MVWQPSAAGGPSKRSADVRAADLDLVRRCKLGEAAAYEEMYRAHAARLYSLLLRMLGGSDDAEDLLQEVFMHAYRKLEGFRGDSSLGTWLYRLAVNVALMEIRARGADPVRMLDPDELPEAGEKIGRASCRERV